MDLMPTVFDLINKPLSPQLYAQGQSIYQTLNTPKKRRHLPTEAFSIRGKKLFEMLKESRTHNRYISHKVKQQIVNYGKYPPKLGLQLGRYKIIYNRLLDQYQYYDTSKDRHEERPLTLSSTDQESLQRHLLRWETLQQWIIKQTLSQTGTE
jgi:hypothetical protein